MNFISLFSGIGGFDLGFERAGMEGVAVCEIDKNAQSVLRRHFPKSKLYSDVKDIGEKTHGRKSIDLICGGFPCQDLSVSGKRAGLAGKRSGLWFEFARAIDEIEPRWVVIENVPGLLSSNGGKDIQIIIDNLTQMGYTVDIDIKDSQEFGVPQRRRRVFLVCARLDGLLKQRTDLSRQISADLLAQILLNAWGATLQASSLVPLHSVYEKPIERCVNLLNKMTSLLGITRERLACRKYQNNLDVLLDQFGEGDKNLVYGLIRKLEIQKGENLEKTVMSLFDLKAENGDMNMSLWLSNYWDGVCKMEKQSTTSISKNQITDHQIYTFAVMALVIIERIILSTNWSESYWNVASSFSTLLQENMNYARQASSNLFIESRLRDGWRDYLSFASNIQIEVDRRIANIRAAEVLFERESGGGNIEESGETREETSNRAPQSFGFSHKASSARNMSIGIEKTPTLETSHNGMSVAYALTSHQGRNEPTSDNLIVDMAQVTSKEHGTKPSKVVQPLNTLGQMSVVWEMQHASEVYRESSHVVPTLTSRAGTGGNNIPMVGVRKLMPIEYERLQGFPDNWTDGQSDSARYKQLGNAVTVNVAEWLGKRIYEVNKDWAQ